MNNIIIDDNSGFCFGVVKAIRKAEEELAKGEPLYCLGDIVHNGQEMERLAKLGLVTINRKQFAGLHSAKVLLSAHGEPPSTYETASRNGITLIDASCPVVLALQKRIREAYGDSSPHNTQIVIYGKQGHAEVNGLVGQTGDRAIVLENENDLHKIDFDKHIRLFSQTTKSLEGFNNLIKTIESRKAATCRFEYADTICRQVANRIPNITNFALANEIIIFVSGQKSSNGKVLFEHAKSINPNTYFISEGNEVKNLQLDFTKKIGICGATSTPRWLMEEVKQNIIVLRDTDRQR